jgi:hypothetical protein
MNALHIFFIFSFVLCWTAPIGKESKESVWIEPQRRVEEEGDNQSTHMSNIRWSARSGFIV